MSGTSSIECKGWELELFRRQRGVSGLGRGLAVVWSVLALGPRGLWRFGMMECGSACGRLQEFLPSIHSENRAVHVTKTCKQVHANLSVVEALAKCVMLIVSMASSRLCHFMWERRLTMNASSSGFLSHVAVGLDFEVRKSTHHSSVNCRSSNSAPSLENQPRGDSQAPPNCASEVRNKHNKDQS